MSIPINEQRSATLTTVATSGTSTTLLSQNKSRIGAIIINDSSVILYLKFGATASSTSYTVSLAAGATYEVPYQYNGRIDGILASSTGTARITEVF